MPNFDDVQAASGIKDDASLLGKLREWEEQVSEYYKEFAPKDPLFDQVTSKTLNLKEMLSKLPPGRRRALLSEYKKIIGLEGVLSTIEPSRILSSADSANPLFQFNINPDELTGPNASILSNIYNRMYIQKGEEIEGAAKYSYNSSNILRTDYLESLFSDIKQPAGKMNIGNNILVFDTETAGLLHEAGIRQISASKMVRQADGTLSAPVKTFDEHFRTARMQMGYIANEGEDATNILNHFERYGGVKYVNDVPGAGDDFVAGMRGFLDQIHQADTIVGHNVSFDLDQIFVGLTKTKAYLQDIDGFKGYLDMVRDHVFEGDKIKDTIELARSHLPDIQVDQIFQASGQVRRHSLENIMLQTNLTELIARDSGGDEGLIKALNMGSGALHASDVDTSITGYLLKYLHSGELDYQDISLSNASVALKPSTISRLRETITQSYAPTPLSNIADFSHIDKRMFEALVRENPDDAFVRSVAKQTGGRIPDDIGELYRIGKETIKTTPLTLKVNPLEQEMFLTRRVFDELDRDITDVDRLSSTGNWRAFAKQNQTGEGFLNKFSTLFKRGVRPPEEEYFKLQERLASHGLPFAGLSMPERWLTSAMSMAPVAGENQKLWNAMSEGEQMAAKLGEDLGISRFLSWDKAYVAKSGKVSLPISVLEAAEQEGVVTKSLTATTDRDIAMMGYSAFETKSGQKTVALDYMLKGSDDARGAQAGRLANWIEAKIGDHTAEVGGKKFSSIFEGVDTEAFLQGLRDTGGVRGISVGSMGGKAGSVAYDAIESFQQGLLKDDAALKMRAGFISSEDGVIRTGAWHLDRWGGDFAKSYVRDLGVAKSRLDDIILKTAENPNLVRTMEVASKGFDTSHIAKALEGYEVIKKSAGHIGGAAAIAGITYMLFKRHQKNKLSNEPFEQMPYESGRSPGYINDADLHYGRSATQPLATAGLTRSLDERKIGHTNMDTSSKYSHLF